MPSTYKCNIFIETNYIGFLFNVITVISGQILTRILKAKIKNFLKSTIRKPVLKSEEIDRLCQNLPI